eukprot:1336698-Pyramimonas_sp.AAC.1
MSVSHWAQSVVAQVAALKCHNAVASRLKAARHHPPLIRGGGESGTAVGSFGDCPFGLPWRARPPPC